MKLINKFTGYAINVGDVVKLKNGRQAELTAINTEYNVISVEGLDGSFKIENSLPSIIDAEFK